MKELKDKQMRQVLITRYLNCETSVEEEKALLQFYQTTSESLDADEEDVRQLVLATDMLGEDETVAIDEDAEEEFDRIVATAPNKRKRSIWPWTTTAAAVAAAIIAVAFFNNPFEKAEDTLPTPIAINKESVSETKAPIAAKASSDSLKAEAPKLKDDEPMRQAKAPKPAKTLAKRKKQKAKATEQSASAPEINVNDVCELASTVFTGAETLTATEESGNVIVTVAYRKGETSAFKLVSNEGGAQTLVAL